MKSSTLSIVDRRFVIAGFAALLTAACSTTARTGPASGPLYSGVEVDVSPLKATGLGDYADKVGRYTTRALLAGYGPLIAPKNKSLPVLTVQIRSMDFGQDSGIEMPDGTEHFVHTNDTLDTIVTLRKGATEISRQPALAVHSTPGKRRWSMQDDEARLVELTEFYAWRLRQILGD